MSDFRHMSSDHIFQEVDEVSDSICNEWEIDFLESVRGCLSRGIALSDGRRKTLERIYDKACKSAY